VADRGLRGCRGDLKKKKVHGHVLTSSVLAIADGHQTRIFKERAPKSTQIFRSKPPMLILLILCLPVQPVIRSDVSLSRAQRALWISKRFPSRSVQFGIFFVTLTHEVVVFCIRAGA
jgi:hypothetical protein